MPVNTNSENRIPLAEETILKIFFVLPCDILITKTRGTLTRGKMMIRIGWMFALNPMAKPSGTATAKSVPKMSLTMLFRSAERMILTPQVADDAFRVIYDKDLCSFLPKPVEDGKIFSPLLF